MSFAVTAKQALVFDLDHTLFDRYATLRACLPRLAAALPLSRAMSRAEQEALFCEADRRCIYRGWQAVFAFLNRERFFRTPVPFKAYEDTLRQAFGEVAVPFPFTRRVLEEFRADGWKIGILTNGSCDLQSRKLDLLGLRPLADAVLITGEIGVDKPHAAPFTEIARRLGITCPGMYYIGDHPLNDVEGSRRAGAEPIWVRSGGYWIYYEIALPALTPSSIASLRPLLPAPAGK